MSTIRIRCRGPASKYLVWARVRNLDRWGEWVGPLRPRPAEAPLHPGLEGELVALGLSIRFEVLEVEPELGRFIWALGSGAVRVRIEHEIAEGLAGAIVSGSAPLVLAAAPLARSALARLVAPERRVSGSRPRRARRSGS